MSKKKDMYSIMTLHSQADVIDGLVNELRDQGTVVRSSSVDDFNTFTTGLTDEDWDLIILQSPHENFTVEEVFNHLVSNNKDIPIIVWMQARDASAIVSMLQQGIAQVLTEDIRGAFATIISRELKKTNDRHDLRYLEMYRQEIEKRCLLLLESSRDPIAYIADGMHIVANLVYVKQFGYKDMDDISGVPLMDLIVSKDQSEFKKIIMQFSYPNAAPVSVQLGCVRLDGSEFLAELSFSVATYEGESCIQLNVHEEKVIAPIEVDSNLTQRDKLNELSKLDVITGLYNRFYFESELALAIKEGAKNNKNCALYYVQLAGYNKMRAKMGMEGIDQVGREMAEVLRGQSNVQAVIARFSEDIYMLLCEQSNMKEINALASKLCKTIESHLFELNDQTFKFTACIGVAVLDDSVAEKKDLIAHAMRAAALVESEQASNGFRVFVKTMESVTSAPVVSAAEELQKAFENNLFKIFFQPIINLRGSSTEFYEVLLRRVNEQGGFESPEQFLKTAGTSKIASIVDRWVIIQSVKTLIARRAQGHSTRILINLTAQSLQDKAFIPWLTVALKSTRLPKESVTFQVNEEDASNYLKRMLELSESLATLGCHLSVSRFGNAENSLAILKHINLRCVKLDGMFTKNIQREEIQSRFNELVQILHKSNVKSIAPLVESATVLSVLWQVGVDYIQGYYLQPPMEGMNYDFTHDDAEEA